MDFLNNMKKIFSIISDVSIMVWRNFIHYIRTPQLLVFSTIQPTMFLLLFTYVFGGAIQSGFDQYIKFLLPGILVQTSLFGSMQTGMGLASDLEKGIIDRFKSMPMAHSSVLAGRIIADAIRNVFVVLLMIMIGSLIGFRFGEVGIVEIVDGIGLIIFFGFAFSWVAAAIGLLVRDLETAQIAGFIWVFPLVFASSIFVPTETMPKYLKFFAENNPVTVVVNSVRGFMLGGVTNDIFLKSLIWILGITIIFMPIAVYLYRRR